MKRKLITVSAAKLLQDLATSILALENLTLKHSEDLAKFLRRQPEITSDDIKRIGEAVSKNNVATMTTKIVNTINENYNLYGSSQINDICHDICSNMLFILKTAHEYQIINTIVISRLKINKNDLIKIVRDFQGYFEDCSRFEDEKFHLYEKCVKITGSGFYNLGFLYYVRLDLFKALEYWQKNQLKLSIENLRDFHLHSADIYYHFLNYHKAVIHYENLYELLNSKLKFSSKFNIYHKWKECLSVISDKEVKKLDLKYTLKYVEELHSKSIEPGDSFEIVSRLTIHQAKQIISENYKALEHYISFTSFTFEHRFFKFDVKIIEAYFRARQRDYEKFIDLLSNVIKSTRHIYNEEIIELYSLYAKYIPEKTLELAHYVVNNYPSNPVGNYCLAISFYHQQRYHLSEMYIKKAISQMDMLTEKDQVEVYRLHAQIHAKFDRCDEALQAIDEAIQLKPEDERLTEEKVKYEQLLDDDKKSKNILINEKESKIKELESEISDLDNETKNELIKLQKLSVSKESLKKQIQHAREADKAGQSNNKLSHVEETRKKKVRYNKNKSNRVRKNLKEVEPQRSKEEVIKLAENKHTKKLEIELENIESQYQEVSESYKTKLLKLRDLNEEKKYYEEVCRVLKNENGQNQNVYKKRREQRKLDKQELLSIIAENSVFIDDLPINNYQFSIMPGDENTHNNTNPNTSSKLLPQEVQKQDKAQQLDRAKTKAQKLIEGINQSMSIYDIDFEECFNVKDYNLYWCNFIKAKPNIFSNLHSQDVIYLIDSFKRRDRKAQHLLHFWSDLETFVLNREFDYIDYSYIIKLLLTFTELNNGALYEKMFIHLSDKLIKNWIENDPSPSHLKQIVRSYSRLTNKDICYNLFCKALEFTKERDISFNNLSSILFASYNRYTCNLLYELMNKIDKQIVAIKEIECTKFELISIYKLLQIYSNIFKKLKQEREKDVDSLKELRQLIINLKNKGKKIIQMIDVTRIRSKELEGIDVSLDDVNAVAQEHVSVSNDEVISNTAKSLDHTLSKVKEFYEIKTMDINGNIIDADEHKISKQLLDDVEVRKVKVECPITAALLDKVIVDEKGIRWKLNVFSSDAKANKEGVSTVYVVREDQIDKASILKELFKSQESRIGYIKRYLTRKNYAVEGCFGVTVLDDKESNEKFRITIAGERLALVVSDGCGWIKASALNSVGHIKDIELQRLSSVSPQALQYFPYNKSVVEEATKGVRVNSGDSAKEKYNKITSGNINGKQYVALPVEGDKVYHGDKFTSAHMILNRNPNMGKESLQAIEKDEVDVNNATAKFVSIAKTVQYSFMFIHQEDKLQAHWAKGLFVVIPDECWPIVCESNIIISSGDIKMPYDSWLKSNTMLSTNVKGVLSVLNSVEESCIGIPQAIMGKLHGDFDGDKVTVIANMPQLHNHVLDNQRNSSSVTNVTKPVKTHSSITNCVYGVIATKQYVLQQFVKLSSIFERYANGKTVAQEVASYCIKQLIYYIDRQEISCYKQQLLDLYQPEYSDIDKLRYVIKKATHIATDAYKSSTDVRQYKVIAQIIESCFKKCALDMNVPYSKNDVNYKTNSMNDPRYDPKSEKFKNVSNSINRSGTYRCNLAYGIYTNNNSNGFVV